jgi:tetratricopeptide (TPR) repeat protein
VCGTRQPERGVWQDKISGHDYMINMMDEYENRTRLDFNHKEWFILTTTVSRRARGVAPEIPLCSESIAEISLSMSKSMPVGPSRRGRKSLLLLAAASSLAWAGDFRPGQDYYNPENPGLIASAEAHHMAQCTAALVRKELSYNGGFGDCRYILDYFPNHPRALAVAAQLALAARRPEWVDDYFVRALSFSPGHARTYLAYGFFLHKRGRLQDGISNYQKAIKLDPTLVDAHYNLGLAYCDLKQYGLANQHAQKAYALGAPLPGLRDKLMRVGEWKAGGSARRESENKASGADPASN